MAHIILLVRVSTVRQQVEIQKKELKQLAIADGWMEQDIIIVEGVGASAIKFNKLYLQQLEELYDTLDNNDIAAVYAWEISRIGRDEEILMHFKNYLIERKIQLVIKNPSLRLLNDDGTVNNGVELAFSLFATMAKQEMQVKQERFKRTREQYKAEGKFTGGRIKIGYKLTKDKHFDEGDDADVVRKVFNMYLQENGSCTSIYRHLSALGYFKPFHINASGSKQIARLLSDKAYIGEGLYKRLIDDETFNKVQAKLATHSIRHKTKDIYYCRGLLYDTTYGTSLYAARSPLAYKSRKTVRTISLSINAMDWMIWHCTFQLLAVYDDDMNTEKEKQYTAKIAENKTKIESYTNDIEDLNGQIARAIDMNIAQPIHYTTERMEATIKRCEKEIDKLKKEIANMQTDNARMQDFLDGVESHSVMYQKNGDWTDEAKKEIIDKLIERIEVTEIGKMKFNIVVKNKIGYIDNSHWEYATLGSKIQLVWVLDNGARIDFSENVRLEKRFERKRYEK